MPGDVVTKIEVTMGSAPEMWGKLVKTSRERFAGSCVRGKQNRLANS